MRIFNADFLPSATEWGRLNLGPYRYMPRTLLVIDDNRSVRESLKFLLLRRGYIVLIAEGGREALALSAQHPVDGALVDVNMPEMNGIEVCRALRQQATAAGREIAVWMMTGARTSEVLKQAREAGALDLFGKPFDLPALYRRFEEKFAERRDDLSSVESRQPSG